MADPVLDIPAKGTRTSTRSREFIQSLERGLEIIRSFDATKPEQTVSEIAAKTALTRATVRRFLITFVQLGYMEMEGRVFRLTPQVLELGYSLLSGIGLPDIALPHLERLVAEVDGSSEASVLDDDEIVYVLRVPSPTLMTIAVNVGARMPAVATSMGRVLLADLPDEELATFLAGQTLKRYQPRTITDRDALRAELMSVRAEGYAIVDQELEEGLISVAAPVRNRDGRAIGAINISTHVGRRNAESVREELVPPLRRTAALIEQDLAGVPRQR